MKTFITVFMFLFAWTWAQAQATTMVQQSINTQDVRSVALNLNAKKIEIKESKGSRILIEMRVTLSMPNEAMLKYLVESGRYDLIQDIDPASGTLRLSRKPNLNVLIVKGAECTEDFEFTIYLPSNIKFASDMGETVSNR